MRAPCETDSGESSTSKFTVESSLTLANPFFFLLLFLAASTGQYLRDSTFVLSASGSPVLDFTLKKSDILHFQEKLMEHRQTCKSPFKSFLNFFDWFVNVCV